MNQLNLAISLGCPAGIGSEVVAKTLAAACKQCRPILFGHWPSFKPFLEFAKGIEIDVVNAPRANGDAVQFVNIPGPHEVIRYPNEDAARIQFDALEQAVNAIKGGFCDAITTAPVSKELINIVHPGFTGHTEYLASRCGLNDDDVTMIFASSTLVVGLITTHIPLAKVPETITPDHYHRTTIHTAQAAAWLTPNTVPRILVAGVNPHAGENGLLGKEEVEVIKPFCQQFNPAIAEVEGPVSPDAIFKMAFAGQANGVIAAYHDQALIPLKLGEFGDWVNVTGGLDFIRTSPDHGTAYNIAGKNIANAAGMRTAIEMAVTLSQGKG